MKTLVWDTETTGVDTENDRIITCYMRAKDGDEVVFEKNWIINPGIDIPVEAAEVHGYTTEWVQENGRTDVAEAIKEISDMLHCYGDHPDGDNYVLVGYNGSYDLAILNSELKRYHDGETLTLEEALVVDPVILSRHFDKYVRGGHKLTTVAALYGFPVDEEKAHAADYDVEMTEFLVPKLLNKAWKELGSARAGMTPDEFLEELQVWQAEWTKSWAEGLTARKARQGQKNEDGSAIIVESAFPY